MTTLVVLAVLMSLAYGCMEALTKSRGRACIAWFQGLLILSRWIISFGTPLTIVFALGVFATGLVALIGYYRHWEWDSSL